MHPGQSDPTSPRWSLQTIYPGFQSPEFFRDLEKLDRTLETASSIQPCTDTSPNTIGRWLRENLAVLDQLTDLYEQLESFCYATYSVATDDEVAIKALNQVSERSVRLADYTVRFRNALAGNAEQILAATRQDPGLQGYETYLREQIDLSSHQMSSAEESLAAALARPGADAWSRLHESISSTLRAPWEQDSQKTVVDLRALASSPERERRRRAWSTELEAWKSVEVPLAYAINGVKGTAVELDRRRGWKDALEHSAHQNRLSKSALEALIATMRSALPLFRRYLKRKANLLSLPRLAFYDLFAPLGAAGRDWSFPEATEFIAAQFAAFDPELGEFARTTIARRWIDALPRSGKVGGAYSIDFPVAGESRILANFDNTWDGLSTLAHELGHAWHSHLLHGVPASQRRYPMVLAETASIFCETLVFESARAAAPATERLYMLEQYLQGATQVIVDILSRFDFESAVMTHRAQSELSPQTLQNLMVTAQRNTYGDALEADELHPYMWAVKGHYYRADFAFYNYPYAFGQLFALALYGRYRSTGPEFAASYRTILQATGREDAVTVARRAGCEIEDPAFWKTAVGELERLVEDFEESAPAHR